MPRPSTGPDTRSILHRGVDRLLGLAALLCCAPYLVLAAACLRLARKGPVLTRSGWDGEEGGLRLEVGGNLLVERLLRRLSFDYLPSAVDVVAKGEPLPRILPRGPRRRIADEFGFNDSDHMERCLRLSAQGRGDRLTDSEKFSVHDFYLHHDRLFIVTGEAFDEDVTEEEKQDQLDSHWIESDGYILSHSVLKAGSKLFPVMRRIDREIRSQVEAERRAHKGARRHVETSRKSSGRSDYAARVAQHRTRTSHGAPATRTPGSRRSSKAAPRGSGGDDSGGGGGSGDGPGASSLSAEQLHSRKRYRSAEAIA
jgi:hypothetical protein